MDKPLRIGVIGVGRAGLKHCRTIGQHPRCQLVGVVDCTPDQLTDPILADIAKFATDDSMLQQCEPDAVVVASPHAMHARQTLAALAAGCHVLVEKPMADSVADCDQMIAAAQSAGLTLMTAHTQHYVATFRRARAMIEAGDIGTPQIGQDQYHAKYLLDSRPSWYLQTHARGMFFNVGVHCLDRLRWLIGCPEKWVHACLVHQDQIDLGGNALIAYTTGASATVTLSGLASHGESQVVIVGDRASLRCTATTLHLNCGRGFTDVPVESGDRAVDQLNEFVNSIIEDRPPETDGYWGRDIVAVADAIYGSDSENRTVTPQLAMRLAAGEHAMPLNRFTKAASSVMVKPG